MPTRSDDTSRTSTPPIRVLSIGVRYGVGGGEGGEGGVSPKKREREKKGIGNIPLNAKVKGAERNAMDEFSSPFFHFFFLSFWIV